MDEKLKKYILIQAIASLIINGIINGLVILLLCIGKDVVMTGVGTALAVFAFDNLITCPLLLSSGADSAVKGLKKQNILAILSPGSTKAARLAGRMAKPRRYGLLLGLPAAAIVFALTAAGVLLFPVDTVTKWGYVAYKAIYTGVVGGMLTVFFNYYAMHSPEPRTAETVSDCKPD